MDWTLVQTSDHSLDFMQTRLLMKLFNAGSVDIVAFNIASAVLRPV